LFAAACFVCHTTGAELSLQKTDTGYNVLADKQIFAGYITDFQGTPIVYPLIGPSGSKMTRDYPMLKRNSNEETDHPHHRSLWFSHGDVSGVNFWLLNEGTIRHQKFRKAETDNNTAVIITENNWTDKKGEILCRDVRSLRFGELEGRNAPGRFIDFDITVTANRSIVFNDTKEGTFGIRVPDTMNITAQKYKTAENPHWGGHLINAEGIKDGELWGKRSPWVDYYGFVDGSIQGIAVLNHPSSFRYPAYWHARDYGLFAANPFGIYHFEGKKKGAGNLKLEEGESFTLRYRIVLHTGTDKEAGIERLFEEYRSCK
jgi:hypothetical protein